MLRNIMKNPFLLLIALRLVSCTEMTNPTRALLAVNASNQADDVGDVQVRTLLME